MTGKFKLAVIDDHEDCRYLLRIFFKDEYIINDFANAQEFLPSLGGEKYDLILSDISMPEMDGFDLLKYLQSREDLLNIPVIAMTAHASDSVCKSALAAGFRACLSKPFDLMALAAAIKECLSVRPAAGAKTAGRSPQ
jgi:CheY-like chemotaxis protein